jgi:hypothetical protein
VVAVSDAMRIVQGVARDANERAVADVALVATSATITTTVVPTHCARRLTGGTS